MAVHVAGRASNYEYVVKSGETSTSHLLTNCNTSGSAGDEVSSCNKIGTGSSQHLPFRFSVSTAVFVLYSSTGCQETGAIIPIRLLARK